MKLLVTPDVLLPTTCNAQKARINESKGQGNSAMYMRKSASRYYKSSTRQSPSLTSSCRRRPCQHDDHCEFNQHNLQQIPSLKRNVRGLGVLTPDLETPVVSKTSVGPDLLQPLEVLTETLVDNVGEDVLALAVGDVSLPVKEPRGDLELGGVLHDGNDSLELVGVELTSPIRMSVACSSTIQKFPGIDTPLVEVNIGLLADQVGVSSTDTLNLSKSVHDLTATLNVGVKETQDVLKKFLSAPFPG